MLLSFYASFRWARKDKYLQKLGVLILLMSFLSSFWFPLSFPFYCKWDYHRLKLSEPYEFSQKYLYTYEIRLSAYSVFELVPQGPVEGGTTGGEGWVRVTHYLVLLLTMTVASVPAGFEFIMLFVFFLMTNIAGALLGRLASKEKTVPRLKGVPIRFLICVGLGIVVLGIGLWLCSGAIVTTGPSNPYYYSYDPFIYIYDGAMFLSFGIAWLFVIIVDTARRNARGRYTQRTDTSRTALNTHRLLISFSQLFLNSLSFKILRE